MGDPSFDYQLQSSVLPPLFRIVCLESQQLFKFYCEMSSEGEEWAAITHTHTHIYTVLAHLFPLILISWTSCFHFCRQAPGCLPDFLDWKSDLCLYFSRGMDVCFKNPMLIHHRHLHKLKVLTETAGICQLLVFVLVTQSCLTLWDPVDCSLPGPSVHGILQARYWSGLPFPFPGGLPNPGIEPGSPALQADSFWSEPPGKHNF